MTLTEILDQVAGLGLIQPLGITDYDGPLVDVVRECHAAAFTHGDLPPSAHQRLSILLEEVGEVAEAMNRHTWEGPSADDVRKELVQVAATALRMVVAHDRLTIPNR